MSVKLSPEMTRCLETAAVSKWIAPVSGGWWLRDTKFYDHAARRDNWSVGSFTTNTIKALVRRGLLERTNQNPKPWWDPVAISAAGLKIVSDAFTKEDSNV